MEKIVILKSPSMDTFDEDLMTECLRILFPGCEIQVSVASQGDGPVAHSGFAMKR